MMSFHLLKFGGLYCEPGAILESPEQQVPGIFHDGKILLWFLMMQEVQPPLALEPAEPFPPHAAHVILPMP